MDQTYLENTFARSSPFPSSRRGVLIFPHNQLSRILRQPPGPCVLAERDVVIFLDHFAVNWVWIVIFSFDQKSFRFKFRVALPEPKLAEIFHAVEIRSHAFHLERHCAGGSPGHWTNPLFLEINTQQVNPTVPHYPTNGRPSPRAAAASSTFSPEPRSIRFSTSNFP